MFDDLDRTIEALLKAELPADVASQVSIGFATPDDSFPPQGFSLPAINLFLFEIRENAALRDTEPTRERRADGTAVLVPPPVHIDCHYLVTAVATKQSGSESELDEHRILGAALKVLLRHRVLPSGVLQGSLAGKTPPVRASAARQDAHPSGIDLWQALKGKPRASLHYTLTVPVDVRDAEELARPVAALAVGGT
jgi:uncharacterized protein DUF4255